MGPLPVSDEFTSCQFLLEVILTIMAAEADIAYDRHGVPVLTVEQIEAKAEHFLSHFARLCLEHPQQAPIPEIMTELQSRYGVKFDLEKSLGRKNGREILGEIRLRERLILIDRSIINRAAVFNFTVAHEIGHLALHRKRDIVFGRQDTNDGTITDTRKDVLAEYDASQETSWSPRRRVEWQANRYSAALLMPAATVRAEVLDWQRRQGIRSAGRVFVDRQEANYCDYLAIIDHLKFVYQVSRKALRIRLQHLGILDTRLPDGSRFFEHTGIYPITRLPSRSPTTRPE